MSEINNRNGNKESVRSDAEVAAAKPQITDHISRARARMAEFKAIHGDDDFSDIFVDKWFAQAPEGWSYEWKTHSVWNKEYPQYLSSLQRNGWSPVSSKEPEVRNLLYPGYENESVIVDGMILMERPRELTDRVREREYRRANEVVRNSERKLADAPAGTAPRTAFAETSPKLRGHVGPVTID
jgi:hypothetical protein